MGKLQRALVGAAMLLCWQPACHARDAAPQVKGAEAPPHLLSIAARKETYYETEPVIIDVIFDEPVTRFGAGDIAFVNPDVGFSRVDVTGGPQSYEVRLQGPAQLTSYGVVLAADQDIIDADGNPLESATGFAAFSVNLDLVSNEPPNASPSAPSLSLTIHFAIPVLNFTLADLHVRKIDVTGSAPVLSGSGDTYVLTMTDLEGDGHVEVESFLNVTDLAGHYLDYTREVWAYFPVDRVAPRVTSVTPLTASLEEGSSVVCLFTFSENVIFQTPLYNDIFHVTGLNASTDFFYPNFYQKTISLGLKNISGNGLLTVMLKSTAVITDVGGMPLAPTELKSEITVIPVPAVLTTMKQRGAALTNADEITVDIKFDKAVYAANLADFSISPTGTVAVDSAALSGSGTAYVLTLSGISGDGDIGLGISPAIDIIDANGLAVIHGDIARTLTIDNTPPQILDFSSSSAQINTGQSTTVRLEFDNSVTGFADNDVELLGSAASGVQASVLAGEALHQIFVGPCPVEGIISLALKANAGIADLAGNSLAVLPQPAEIKVVDATPLQLLGISSESTVLSGGSAVFDITFSRAAYGVDAEDFLVVVNGGSFATATLGGESDHYSLTVEGIAGGTGVTVSLAAASSITAFSGANLEASALSATVPIPQAGDGEGDSHFEGEPASADTDGNGVLDLAELLRSIQLFNAQAFGCQDGTEDGYSPDSGSRDCAPHDSDYNPQDWALNLSEVLRLVQLFSVGGYHRCHEGEAASEDGFCPN